MLELRPNKTKNIEQIRAELAQLLRRMDSYDVRVVYGFAKRLDAQRVETNEAQKDKAS